jgi:Sap-like sulfolipid-1-addressing protein
MVDQMSKIASSPWIAIVAAGATLANPGGFIPIAIKDISETNPSTTGYIVEWIFFSVVSLLPLAVALIMLAVSPDWATRLLRRVRDWLVRNARLIGAVIMLLLAAVLLRNGISGLTHMS